MNITLGYVARLSRHKTCDRKLNPIIAFPRHQESFVASFQFLKIIERRYDVTANLCESGVTVNRTTLNAFDNEANLCRIISENKA